MKKHIDAFMPGTCCFFLLLFVSLNAFSQRPQNNGSVINYIGSSSAVGGSIGIGTTTPNPSALLEISSPSQGFLPPRMTVIERDLISNPAEGLMIFNTSSGCPNYYFGGSWHEWCGTRVLPLATLSGLNCNSANISGSLLMGMPASGVSCTIPYTGGNGGIFSSQSFASTGVNGLTANIVSDTLANGSGTLVCTITGTPDNSGNATFQISIGSQTCSFSINVGLPAPAIVSSSPASPSNTSTTPTLTISGPANKTIQVFNNATGTGSPIITAVANVNSGGIYYALITVTATSNSSTTFTAKAVDGIGNTSELSNSFVYRHDNVSPSAPVIVSSTPASPSNASTTPTLTLTGEVGSTIRIYSGSSCSGSVLASGVVSAGGTAAITVTVTSNATNILTATATDAAGNISSCSNTFTYVHDNIAPTSPVFTSSTPSSPSRLTTTPILNLTGEVGSTIKIYSGSGCSGSVLASGVVSAGGTAAITVTVIANTANVFTATATDAAGNISSCSNTFTYVHDATAPSTPVITSSSPASPSNSSTTPTLIITGEIGSTIRVYAGSSCAGSVLASGVVSAGGTAAIAVSVASNSTTFFTATAIDAAGNLSACSSPFTYIHDNIAPNAPTITSSFPTSPGNSLTPTLIINGEAGSTLRVYNNSGGTGSPVNTVTIPAGGLATVSVTVTSASTTIFTARVTDAAGNVSGLSSGFSYTHTP